MLGVRMNSFNDLILGEPEQDANSALTELDKGLRSGKVGEQCEAIVRFPRLFEKYPFPILINSSFLKLADVFRLGNNFLRLWVLRVCQQSEKHLDKILNVDEFVRRVYSVLHSNDPVARALTLQTLGAVAGIISDRQNVHHAIRLGLDSHDNIEVDAAIYATTQFAAHSNIFAASMCNKLSDMVVCESTCSERRVKLIRALRRVHGGAIKAQSVLTLLRGLVIRYPAEATTCAAIAALTAIASDTVVHIPDQVWLLLQAARSAKRNVRVAALRGLRRLAHFATLWPAEAAIKELPQVASAHDDTQLEMCLQVMQILVHSPAICAAVVTSPQQNEESAPEAMTNRGLRSLCSSALNSDNLGVASRAANVLSEITIYCYNEKLPTDNVKELLFALESLVIVTGVQVKKAGCNNPENTIRPLRLALKCLVDVCAADDTHSKRVARVLASQLKVISVCEPNEDTLKRVNALLEGLGALGGAPNGAFSLIPIMPSIVCKLKEAANALALSTDDKIDDIKMDLDYVEPTNASLEDNQLGTVIVLLCTLLVQAASGATLQGKLQVNGKWREGVKGTLQNLDGWTRYRVARAAMRYGQHELASSIMENMIMEMGSGGGSASGGTASLQWCTALRKIAKAEAQLQCASAAPERIIDALNEAISLHYKALAQLKAGACGCTSGGASGWRCGRCGSVGARASLLSILLSAAGGARALCSAPPAAVAAAAAAAARDAAAAAGAAAPALRSASKRAAAAARERRGQAKAAFDATTADLRHLQISQYACEQLARLLDRVASPNYQDRLEPWLSQQPFVAQSLEESLLLKPCEEIDDIAKKLFDGRDGGGQGITHRHAEAMLCAIRSHCRALSAWPRRAWTGTSGVFGAARCRLALSPAPRALTAGSSAAAAAPPSATVSADLAVSVPHGHHFALKIEGVIQRDQVGKRKSFERAVKSVQLTITATPLAKPNDKFSCDQSPPIITAVQIVSPLRDFFSAQQLLALPAPTTAGPTPITGLYNVVVEAAFVDETGEVWNTGPKASVSVKVLEDLTTKNVSNQAARGRF